MLETVMRKAARADMGQIMRLQVSAFAGEQQIPAGDIAVPDEKQPQWWCAETGGRIVGAVAAWREDGQAHWGRFVVDPRLRGQHIGTRLAAHSLESLFAQGIDQIHIDARETTVKILCGMGGRITGAPVPFYVGTVTPMVLEKARYRA